VPSSLVSRGSGVMRPAPIVRLARQLRVYRRGLIAELADELGLTTSSICQWDDVPAERVPDVARVLGVGRHQIRPDLWDPPPRRCRR
jgi:DNA-binding transcriptional regulator YdaS (Cro superfamily)